MSINGHRATSWERPESGFLGPLRVAATIALVAGAAGSFGLTLRAGHRNQSRLLLMLFSVWVLSPYLALALASVISKRWSVFTRVTLYGVMLAVSLASLAIYGDVAFGPPRAKPAFVFLVVPAASWLLIGIDLAISAWISRKRSR